MRFIPRHQIIDTARVRERQQVIIIGVFGNIDLWQLFHDDGNITKLVDKTARQNRVKPRPDFRVARDLRQLIKLRRGGNEIEAPLTPILNQLRRRR